MILFKIQKTISENHHCFVMTKDKCNIPKTSCSRNFNKIHYKINKVSKTKNDKY